MQHGAFLTSSSAAFALPMTSRIGPATDLATAPVAAAAGAAAAAAGAAAAAAGAASAAGVSAAAGGASGSSAAVSAPAGASGKRSSYSDRVVWRSAESVSRSCGVSGGDVRGEAGGKPQGGSDGGEAMIG